MEKRAPFTAGSQRRRPQAVPIGPERPADIASLEKGFPFPCWKKPFPLVAVAAEQAQQHQEQVDEVQIQFQGAQQGTAAHGRGVVHRGVHAEDAQLLGIIGGKAGEDQHADAADDEVHHAAGQEDVDDGRDDDAEQAHDQEVAHAGQVTPGHRAVHRHGQEGARGRQEGIGDGADGIDHEDAGQGQAGQGRIGDEHRRGRGGRHFVDSGAQGDDQTELGHDEGDHDRHVAQDGHLQVGAGRHGKGRHGRDGQAGGHPHVDLAHIDGNGAHSALRNGTSSHVFPPGFGRAACAAVLSFLA